MQTPKKSILIALVAILGTASAVAQTALSFSGDRAVIASGGRHYIPQSVWNAHQTLYIDIVNSWEPEIGFENWTGQNSWVPEMNSQWMGNVNAQRQQYIKIDVPGLWTNMYQGNVGNLYIRRIPDPQVGKDQTVNAASPYLSDNQFGPSGGKRIVAENLADLKLDDAFVTGNSYNWLQKSINGTFISISQNQTDYQVTSSGQYRIRTSNGSGISPHNLDFEVIIQNASVPVQSVSLNKTSLTKTVGDPAETLMATISPSNATNQNVSWSTSNASVATVANGVVNFVGVGQALITVTTQDGNKTATCNVTVNAATVAVQSVSLNKTTTTLTVGGEETLVATVNPTNATNKSVSWSSSNASVASVDANGKVKALTAGTTTITVITQDGNKTATCNVTVNAATIAVKSVSLNKTTTTLTVGGEETLVATVTPDNATNKTVWWNSVNSSIVSVDADGKIKALAVGSSIIQATTQDGGKEAVCTVTVEDMLPFPVFDGLEGEYAQSSVSIPLKLKGKDAEKFTVFKVNGETKSEFIPATKGSFLIEAATADGKSRIETYITVK